MRSRRLGAFFASIVVLLLLVTLGCQAEQRPATGGGGSVQRIGSPQTGSVYGVSGSVSAVMPRPAGASPVASSGGITPGDGVYTPVGNVDGYLMFGPDFMDISALTNVVNEGRPLPVEE